MPYTYGLAKIQTVELTERELLNHLPDAVEKQAGSGLLLNFGSDLDCEASEATDWMPMLGINYAKPRFVHGRLFT